MPQEYPLRRIRALGDAVRKELSPQLDLLSSHTGRPAIAPEQWLRALWLQVRFAVRGSRLRMEPHDDHRLFRWFVGWNSVVSLSTLTNRHGSPRRGQLPITGSQLSGSSSVQTLMFVSQNPYRSKRF